MLSKRLQTLADMVPEGKKVVDVGCDHGFLDIFLVQSGRASGAIAMDVRKGPLSAAAQHIREAGLEKQIETRLSDGLKDFQVGEARVLICAGMGGPLMQRILSEWPEKTESFQEMILQPQSELREFRMFLREAGYTVLEERIVLEDGKYYFPMKVLPGRRNTYPQTGDKADGEKSLAGNWIDGGKLQPGNKSDGGKTQTGKEAVGEERPGIRRQDPGEISRLQEIFDRYGELLVRHREPLLLQYLKQQNKILEDILEKLRVSDTVEERRRQRLLEVEKERELLLEAIRRMQQES